MKKSKKKSGKKNTTPHATGQVIHLPAGKKSVLHVAFGTVKDHGPLHKRFQGEQWRSTPLELRMHAKTPFPDLSPLYALRDANFDAAWLIHTLEYLYAYQIPEILSQLRRILKNDGLLLFTVPDAQKAAESAYRQGMEKPLYQTRLGPVAAIDLLYGFRPGLLNDPVHHAHRTGFSPGSLGTRVREAGFADIKVQRDGYKLWAAAYKRHPMPERNEMQILGPDVNEMMSKRDELDQEPYLWKGFPPK